MPEPIFAVSFLACGLTAAGAGPIEEGAVLSMGGCAPAGWVPVGGTDAGLDAPGALGGAAGALDGMPGGFGAPGKLGGFGIDGAEGG